jgi:uncharacterized protein
LLFPLAPFSRLAYPDPVPTDTIDIQLRSVIRMQDGYAVFLGTVKKVFVVYVDPAIGQILAIALGSIKKERPLTHDLMGNVFVAFGIKLERVVINDAQAGTFYARMILKMENEMGVKLVEADTRPSDAIVLALNLKKPITITAPLFAKLEDASALMKKLLGKQN